MQTIIFALVTILWISCAAISRKKRREIKEFLDEIREIEGKNFEYGFRQGSVAMFNSLKNQGIVPEWLELELDTIFAPKPKDSDAPRQACSDEEFLKSMGVKF
jgi:hypothetical protein